MSAIAERLNFSTVQGAASPFLGVSARDGAVAVAVAVVVETCRSLSSETAGTANYGCYDSL